MPEILNNRRSYFLDTIYSVRNDEKLLLFNALPITDLQEQQLVVEFLETEFTNEAYDYPFHTLEFDKAAALWAARYLYTTAQLLLYRTYSVEQLPMLLAGFKDDLTPEAILSADLCLRFLPDLFDLANKLDYSDPIQSCIVSTLSIWQYSGIKIADATLTPKLEIIFSNPCLKQLYLNRILETDNPYLKKHPVIQQELSAIAGIYQTFFLHNYNYEKP
ncbi:hypothetical protein [Flavihumibacter sp. CACIAM 22H1]|uniref:hypothetical protein n=1 Tax=Flavihumibacter sp. CACIAM 22H1 TaxID=1812911 RepID=UPI0007A886EE|nr:hypothetical protein [Flavihumibacter sp. CACIAM 22H1]KYP15341.1 MAG: hypothetical protein A1D16_15690 [Flavihumibacter sp. CACIAM 22H1]